MKTIFLSLGFALTLGVVHVSAQTASSPLPATEPEAASGGSCPLCKMGGDSKGPVKTDVAFKQGGEKPADDAERVVLDLEQKWCESEARHDVAFLEKVEVDGFTFTDATGKVTGKQEEIAEAKQGGEPINFKLSDMKVHLYGNTAIVTGQTAFSPADLSQVSSAAYRWTDVFVRQANGEWQVVASQATALDQGKGGEGKPSE